MAVGAGVGGAVGGGEPGVVLTLEIFEQRGEEILVPALDDGGRGVGGDGPRAGEGDLMPAVEGNFARAYHTLPAPGV